MDKIFDAVSNFLSRPLGFLAVHFFMMAAYLLLATDLYTMILSVVAISISSFILVAQLKGDLALHLKLDKLIEASDANNKWIGEEKKRLTEIEKDTGG